MRERLITKIMSLNKSTISLQTAMDIVDAIIDIGAIVPPCKVGDTVFVCNRNKGEIYENTVVCIKIRSKGLARNTMSLEDSNINKEPSCRKFKWGHVGKTVFLTKEEAEVALKGGAE